MVALRKHPCADCRFCQFCPETRCRACRGRREAGRKLSMAEQIALHAACNPKPGQPDKPILYVPNPYRKSP